MRGKPYEFTDAEIQYIISNWGKESPHSMKKKFGCTWYAVCKIAEEHGLELPSGGRRQAYAGPLPLRREEAEEVTSIQARRLFKRAVCIWNVYAARSDGRTMGACRANGRANACRVAFELITPS